MDPAHRDLRVQDPRPSGSAIRPSVRREADRRPSTDPGDAPVRAYNRPTMPIYLDHAATTPVRPEVLEAMLPFLGGDVRQPVLDRTRSAASPARPSTTPTTGSPARSAATPREVVFTSGGTEASNLALKGAAWAGRARGARIVASAVEHHAVGHTLAHLEKFGFEVVEVPVDRYGRVDPDGVEAAINDRTILVAVMLANNEVGTLQPIAEVARVVRAHRGVLLHVDAVQAAPWVDLDVDALGADFVALGAHKAEGPKGTGALWIRKGTHLLAQQHGGVAGAPPAGRHGERRGRRRHGAGVRAGRRRAARDRRAGAGRCATDWPPPSRRSRASSSPGTRSSACPTSCPWSSHLVDGPSVTVALDLEGIAASTGSACTSGSTEVSHVLAAMGYPEDEARGAVRLSLGRSTTDAEIDEASRVVPEVIAAAGSSRAPRTSRRRPRAPPGVAAG